MNTQAAALFNLIASDEQVSDLLQRPEMQYVPQPVRNAFAQQRQGHLNAYAANGLSAAQRAPFVG